jgi:hypothetical protein
MLVFPNSVGMQEHDVAPFRHPCTETIHCHLMFALHFCIIHDDSAALVRE